MSGWRVPGYVVEGLLGRGGSAEVWQGRVVRSGDSVALKRVVIDDVEALAAVRAEAALLTALDHPNLVRLHEFITAGDAAVLVLDLAAGGSLADLIGARGRLAPGEAITALAPVAAALAHAHTASVVHGDISAANVLFTDAGLPLLSDLGVAQLLGDWRAVHCTPAYVDPAVAAGAPPTPHSDVFTLGGVLLHALTGTPTWPEESAEAALERARRNDGPDAADRLAAAGVPEATAAVVLRALDADPNRRGSAAEFALDLRHSGAPVAVELAAGRPRRVVTPSPRHAATPARAALPAAGRARATALAGRPDFERPAALRTSALAQLPQTRMVGPRPRPVLPRRPDPRLRRRRAWWVGAGMLVAALVAGAVLWAPWRGNAASPRRQHAATTRLASPSRADDTAGRLGAAGNVSAAGDSGPARDSGAALRASTAPPDSWPSALDALEALDARRARAFADRTPALLQQVYGDAGLLRKDTATLRRLVPPGCGLLGAQTRYADVHIQIQQADRLVLTVSARLARSVLTCPGRPARRLTGAGPTRLRIELTRTSAGVRITAQQVVGTR